MNILSGWEGQEGEGPAKAGGDGQEVYQLHGASPGAAPSTAQGAWWGGEAGRQWDSLKGVLGAGQGHALVLVGDGVTEAPPGHTVEPDPERAGEREPREMAGRGHVPGGPGGQAGGVRTSHCLGPAEHWLICRCGVEGAHGKVEQDR